MSFRPLAFIYITWVSVVASCIVKTYVSKLRMETKNNPQLKQKTA